MGFDSILVFILFKLKKCPNISGIRVVNKDIYNIIKYVYFKLMLFFRTVH